MYIHTYTYAYIYKQLPFHWTSDSVRVVQPRSDLQVKSPIGKAGLLDKYGGLNSFLLYLYMHMYTYSMYMYVYSSHACLRTHIQTQREWWETAKD